jgi:hypothetical protein
VTAKIEEQVTLTPEQESLVRKALSLAAFTCLKTDSNEKSG